MTTRRRPAERRRLAPALGVLGLHLLLAAAWWAGRGPQPVTAPERPAWLRLLPPDRPEPVAAPAPPPPARAPRPATPTPAAALPRETTPEPPRPAEPQAITLPAPAASAPSPAAPPPLRLALPPASPASGPPSLREQMLRDPRANSRPSRAATEALQGLGDPGPALQEEVMAGEGHRRVRIGRDCFIVREARAAQLDPHNQSTNPTPKQIDRCN